MSRALRCRWSIAQRSGEGENRRAWRAGVPGFTSRVEFETNRYSVPYHLVGRTVDVEVEGGELVVHWAGQAVAEHRITDSRHRDTQDPGHVEGLVRRTYKALRPCELQRPLSDYEAVVGGERW